MQATIYNISPFDALIGTTIKFSWSGNQIFKNRCIIKNNDTNEIVYDKTIDSFKYEHPIDLTTATLKNGEKYNAYITVFDRENKESDIQSIGKSFLCLKTPIFTFNNISPNQVIAASSYKVALSYSQENGELLDSWSISLYTLSHTVLATSGTVYDTSDLSYLFSGFANKNKYSVRAIGRTVNGIDLDTGFVDISVTYDIRNVFSLLEPTNMAKQGGIQIRSNIVSSEGHPEKDVVYINGEYVDLRDNVLWYTEGFEFKNDFSCAIVFYNTKPNQTVLTLYNDNHDELTISATYRVGYWESTEMRGRYELRITSYYSTVVIYSNILDLPTDDDKIGVCVTRDKGFYNIEIANLGKVV